MIVGCRINDVGVQDRTKTVGHRYKPVGSVSL